MKIREFLELFKRDDIDLERELDLRVFIESHRSTSFTSKCTIDVSTEEDGSVTLSLDGEEEEFT